MRDEVSDRDVGLVSDGRNDGDLTTGDGARDDFFVEGPEIFDRSAAPSNDDDVDSRDETDGAYSNTDLERGVFALHTDRPSHQVYVGVLSAEHFDDVANCGALERGRDPDVPGQPGQRPLARGVEEYLR